MAITVVGVGAVDSAAGPITPPFPVQALQDDDLLIGVGESNGNMPYTVPTGWAHVLGSPVNVDTSTQLTVIYKRFVTGDTAQSWGNSGNHNIGRIIAFRSVKTTGDPWNVAPAASQETAANTSAEFPSVTTTVIDCLIVLCIATGRDANSTANLGTVTNGALSSITERMDNWTNVQAGGGFGMVTGFKATAGAVGTSTATMGSTDAKALLTLALEPAAEGPTNKSDSDAGTGSESASVDQGVTLGPVREFDGTDDEIVTATGGCSAMGFGTVAALFKARDFSATNSIFRPHSSGGTNLGQMLGITSSSGLVQWAAGGVGSNGPALTAGRWYLVVMRKDTGTVTPRFSVYDYTTTTWIHAGGSNTRPDLTAPGATGTIRMSFQSTSEYFDGWMAVRAAWANALPWSADTTGDTAIEGAGLEDALQSWVDASPTALWPFNQAAVGDGVLDIIGAADESSRVGTTAITTDSPVPFDWSLVTQKSDSDTGTGSETGALAAAVPATDTGTGSEATASIAAVPATDSGTGAEAASVDQGTVPKADTDTATGSEAATLAVVLADSDAGTGTEAASVDQGATAKSDTDTGTGAETSSLLYQALGEIGIATEQATVEVAGVGDKSDSDSGSGAETVVLIAALLGDDTGTGAEAASVDQGATPKADTDISTGSETASVAAVVAASDPGVGTDTAALTAALAATETGTGTESASVPASGDKSSTDDGTGTEQVKTLALTATDPATGADSITARGLPVADSGTGTDSAVRAILGEDKVGADTGTGTEQVIFRAIAAVELAEAAEQIAGRVLATTDAGTGGESVDAVGPPASTVPRPGAGFVTRPGVAVVDRPFAGMVPR